MFFRDVQKVAQKLDIRFNKVELPLSISYILADQPELETEPESEILFITLNRGKS